jgi:hypothetical protein
MDRDELLKMLDLRGKEKGKETSEVSITPQAEEGTPDGLSPTALDLDEWGLRRGQEVLAESPRLRQTGLDAFAVADFHAAGFEPEPVLLDACQDGRRHEFLAQLLQTPDYHALHTATQLDPLASSIAATAFAEQFAALNKEDEKRSEGGTSKDAGETLDHEMATLRAVGRAVSEAGKEVEECKEACAALGMGAGSPGSNDPRAIADLFRRVRSSPILRRICELAGRYRRLAQSKQRRKTTHGVDDVVGVVLDGDVGRLLPSELVRLADDELADDTLRRLVERQTMCREYHATEPVGKGPIVVVVDESGSMNGSKIETAKALALALAWMLGSSADGVRWSPTPARVASVCWPCHRAAGTSLHFWCGWRSSSAKGRTSICRCGSCPTTSEGCAARQGSRTSSPSPMPCCVSRRVCASPSTPGRPR